MGLSQNEAARIIAQKTAETRIKRDALPLESPLMARGKLLLPVSLISKEKPVDQDARATRERVDACLKSCRVPKRYQSADIDDVERVPEYCRPKYADAVLAIRRLIEQPALVVLLGGNGVGKTWMASALILEFCRLGRSAMFADASDYFLALDQAREIESRSALQVEVDFLKPELLVLDAMEERADTPAKDRMLTRLINKRYVAVKSTLLVTNETADRFCERVGKTAADRIQDGGGMIECLWSSLRGRIG